MSKVLVPIYCNAFPIRFSFEKASWYFRKKAKTIVIPKKPETLFGKNDRHPFFAVEDRLELVEPPFDRSTEEEKKEELQVVQTDPVVEI